MRDVGFAGSAPPFRGRERAAVDVDVGPERRSPRYHETCLALGSVEESSAAVSTPRSAGDGRQEIRLTSMVPIQLPVLGNLACRLLVKALIRVAG